jgi:hypothetical protein
MGAAERAHSSTMKIVLSGLTLLTDSLYTDFYQALDWEK